RNPRPVWPVVQLVRELVKNLLQLEEPQERARMIRIVWKNASLGCAAIIATQISAEKRVARVALPAADADLAGSLVEPFRLHAERRRRIGERPQHSCDVAQRTGLGASLGQRPGRFALEVDDHEIVARRSQHLAE